jgi:hypothetical protein
VRNSFKVALVAIVVVVVMGALGFRLGHPQSGLSSAVGDARTSILLYKQVDKFSAGDRVLVDIGDSELSPATSIIRSVDGENIEVQAGDLRVQVTPDQIKGRVLALFPFLGAILSVVGL